MTKQNYNDPLGNGEGYSDLTAYNAIKSADSEQIKERERFFKLLNTIFYIVKLAGFEIEGRIVLKDTKSGKVWR